EDGPDFVTWRSACGVTGVSAVEESLVGSVSLVVVVPVAVFDSEPVTLEPTCTTSVNEALAPAARLERVSVTVPLALTAGVLIPNDGPLSWDSDTKVVPFGSGSLTDTDCASLAPMLSTVMV